MNSFEILYNSKIGPIYLVASEAGLQGLYFKKTNHSVFRNDNKCISEIFDEAVKQLEEYFDGRRKNFDLCLDPQGTDFQKKVWHHLQKIPYGKTFSYKDIASKLNDKNASRAVGTANGKNPICIIIPCHRVINSNGELGGYSGGLDIKKKLLEIESLNH